MRFFIQLSYNGKEYNGWQSQINAPGIQDVVERCLTFKLKHKVSITGCGRTDTGVHAKKFFAHFDSSQDQNTITSASFLHHLNNCLPDDIAVSRIFPVQDEAHARFDAISRTYHYYFHIEKNPFLTQNSLFVFGNPDLKAMQNCANLLLEYDDFTSFSKLHSQTKTNLCKLSHAEIIPTKDGYYFSITANRFLRNMVRAIMGTLLEAGHGKISESSFRMIVEGKNRSLAGFSAPAHALYLVDIAYPTGVIPEEQS